MRFSVPPAGKKNSTAGGVQLFAAHARA